MSVTNVGAHQTGLSGIPSVQFLISVSSSTSCPFFLRFFDSATSGPFYWPAREDKPPGGDELVDTLA